MSKWTRRAKKLGLGPVEVLAGDLERFKKEASESAENLRFAFEGEGVPMEELPTPDEAGLTLVESAYRSSFHNLADRGVLEYLMGLFLGEAAIALHGGQWAIYRGRYSVFHPFVVELAAGGRFVEPLLLCSDLGDKNALAGARSGSALVHFVRNLDKLAMK